LADGDKKDDLKARLGIKKKLGAAAVPGPVVEGLPPIEPEKPAGPPKPSKEDIDAAKKAADALARQAGPAIEEFGIGAPQKTPLPGPLPTGAARVEYVQVPAEPDPAEQKKRLAILLGTVVIAALAAFLMGRSCSGSAAKAEQKANITNELKLKQELFAKKQPIFDRMKNLESAVSSIVGRIKETTKQKGDIMALQEPMDAVFGDMDRFVADNIYVAPEEVLGSAVYDAGLMRHLVDYAVKTEQVHSEVAGAVKEWKQLKLLSSAAPPENATRWMVVQTEERDVPNLGKIPVGKGSWLAKPGRPVKTTTTNADGTPLDEWNQTDVYLVGGTKPITVKTTQVVQVDQSQFFQEQSQLQKVLAVTRMTKILTDLLPELRSLDPASVVQLVNAAPAEGL